MQDFHSSGRRLFAIQGEQRSRPPQHALKCPRCDSINTKFCYYNNYNISQPRHFCRSCRRYWTKGGVLRNVPVGGGIRKAKQSGIHKSKTSVSSYDAVIAQHKSLNSENSSSNGSSLSAYTTLANITATTTTSGMTTTDVSKSSSSTSSIPAILLDFNEPSTRLFNISHSSTQITTIDPLMTNQSSSVRNILPGIGMFKWQQQNQLQWTETDRMGETGLESRRSNGGLAGNGDWQDNANQGLFDQSYWSQNHRNDDDHDHDRDHHISYLF